MIDSAVEELVVEVHCVEGKLLTSSLLKTFAMDYIFSRMEKGYEKKLIIAGSLVLVIVVAVLGFLPST